MNCLTKENKEEQGGSARNTAPASCGRGAPVVTARVRGSDHIAVNVQAALSGGEAHRPRTFDRRAPSQLAMQGRASGDDCLVRLYYMRQRPADAKPDRAWVTFCSAPSAAWPARSEPGAVSGDHHGVGRQIQVDRDIEGRVLRMRQGNSLLVLGHRLLSDAMSGRAPPVTECRSAQPHAVTVPRAAASTRQTVERQCLFWRPIRWLSANPSSARPSRLRLRAPAVDRPKRSTV